mgnify:CR=1 FL=1
MGIRGLNTVIKKYAEDAIQNFNISKYKGSKVAIDCSILLYKFKYASRADNSHLIGIANRVKFYLMNGILPIFVFDGKPPQEKKDTIINRKVERNTAKDTLNTISIIPDTLKTLETAVYTGLQDIIQEEGLGYVILNDAKRNVTREYEISIRRQY